MKNLLIAIAVIFCGAAFASDSLRADATKSIQQFKKKDAGISTFFDKSVGYVVYPNVGKGGFIVGGAHGNGIVYEKGAVIGQSELVQATIGFQAGGQEFSEVVFFEDAAAFNAFKKEEFSVSAQVGAVIAKDGASKKAKYHEGVAVFLLPKGGLMLEASVGGQKLSFKPNK